MATVTATGYRHEVLSADASATWIINHNLGTLTPAVECWVDVAGVKTKIIPVKIVATSSSVATVTFSQNFYGTAITV